MLIKNLEIIAEKGKKIMRVVFDSASSKTLVKYDKVKDIATIIKLPMKRKFILGDGKTEISTNKACILSATINSKNIDLWCYVVDALSKELIIGEDMMETWDIKLYLRKKQVYVGKNPDALEFI